METLDMKATCGHDDMLGYLIGTPCHNCTVKAHKQAMGVAR